MLESPRNRHGEQIYSASTASSAMAFNLAPFPPGQVVRCYPESAFTIAFYEPEMALSKAPILCLDLTIQLD
jgi:hypothetical protein